MGGWVHAESLSSLGFALGVVRFIRGRWVHAMAPWWSLGSFGVVEFTLVRHGWRWVDPESLGSLRFTLGLVGFIH